VSPVPQIVTREFPFPVYSQQYHREIILTLPANYFIIQSRQCRVTQADVKLDAITIIER